jgi:hypothetical protein
LSSSSHANATSFGKWLMQSHTTPHPNYPSSHFMQTHTFFQSSIHYYWGLLEKFQTNFKSLFLTDFSANAFFSSLHHNGILYVPPTNSTYLHSLSLSLSIMN